MAAAEADGVHRQPPGILPVPAFQKCCERTSRTLYVKSRLPAWNEKFASTIASSCSLQGQMDNGGTKGTPFSPPPFFWEGGHDIFLFISVPLAVSGSIKTLDFHSDTNRIFQPEPRWKSDFHS